MSIQSGGGVGKGTSIISLPYWQLNFNNNLPTNFPSIYQEIMFFQTKSPFFQPVFFVWDAPDNKFEHSF